MFGERTDLPGNQTTPDGVKDPLVFSAGWLIGLLSRCLSGWGGILLIPGRIPGGIRPGVSLRGGHPLWISLLLPLPRFLRMGTCARTSIGLYTSFMRTRPSFLGEAGRTEADRKQPQYNTYPHDSLSYFVRKVHHPPEKVKKPTMENGAVCPATIKPSTQHQLLHCCALPVPPSTNHSTAGKAHILVIRALHRGVTSPRHRNRTLQERIRFLQLIRPIKYHAVRRETRHSEFRIVIIPCPHHVSVTND